MMEVEEIWKDVPGYEGKYQASTLGRVKSLARYIKGKGNGLKPIQERIIVPLRSNLGYVFINLFNGTKPRKFYVHRLIMYVFKGPSELGVDHKNGIKTDNSLINLEYVTARENITRSRLRIKNSNLPTGVVKVDRKTPYVAHASINGKRLHLGAFMTIEEASAAYQKAIINQ